MQLPEHGFQFSCERKSRNQLHKGRYGEWLALDQVLLANYVTHLFILGTAINRQCCSSSGVVLIRTLERIL